MAGTQKIKYGLLVAGLALVIWFIKDAFTQPGVQDLQGNFTETAFYRNENNTGPIVRIYVVTVSDTLWNQMQQYGDYMPHTKYGTTTVYFFKDGLPAPTALYPGQANFDAAFRPNTLAKYEKDAMGQVSFVTWPFNR